ncbi:MAG: hypothetical protein RLZZ184_1510 [Cyanobacteriota bacterium]|jgi:hypothetical protein
MAVQLSDLDNDMKVMDYVVSNLLKQGKKSQESFMNYDTEEYEYTGDCVYRGFIRDDQGTIIDQLKCAVGHIISDEVYDEQLESQTVDNTHVLDAVKVSCENWEVTDNSLGMLKVLQRIHDQIDIERWETYFLYVRQQIIDEFDGRSIMSSESATPYAMTLTRFQSSLKLDEYVFGNYPRIEL